MIGTLRRVELEGLKVVSRTLISAAANKVEEREIAARNSSTARVIVFDLGRWQTQLCDRHYRRRTEASLGEPRMQVVDRIEIM